MPVTTHDTIWVNNRGKKQPVAGSQSGDEYKNTWAQIAGILSGMPALDFACAFVISLLSVPRRPACVTLSS